MGGTGKGNCMNDDNKKRPVPLRGAGLFLFGGKKGGERSRAMGIVFFVRRRNCYGKVFK